MVKLGEEMETIAIKLDELQGQHECMKHCDNFNKLRNMTSLEKYRPKRLF